MTAHPFWQLATPWTPAQWEEIVSLAKRVRELRKQARAARAREHKLRYTIYDSSESRTLEWRARNLEAQVRYFADIRLKDIDEARLDEYLKSLNTKDKQ
jgi:hypothetical protein